MKTYGVIMAGGGGTRFWPLSTKEEPKQFLNLSGKDIMVNETIDRQKGLIEEEDLFIVTNASQAELMLEKTEGRVKKDHILAEPAARNTAACIGYAAMEILKKYGDGIMCIFAADAHIRDSLEYRRVMKEAVRTAEETDALVTIGIHPTFPSTGYGYIRHSAQEGKVYHKVEEFVEKELPQCGVIGFDGRTVGIAEGRGYEKIAKEKNGRLDQGRDLGGIVWADRPEMPKEKAFRLDVKYAGESTGSKLARIQEKMEECGADAHLVSSLDDIAWMLNIRGGDVAYCPLVLSYALVWKDHVDFYADRDKFSDELLEELNEDGVRLLPYAQVYEDVKRLEKAEASESENITDNYYS